MPPDSFESGLFVLVGGTGLEQQRRRPPPAAETGSRGWGRVLIFQSPAKGLRKNQQTQPVQAPAVRFRQGSQRLGMSTKKDAARPFGLGTFFVVDGTGREQERAKAGYHRSDGILPFVLYDAFGGQSLRTCVPKGYTPLARCNTLDFVPKFVCQRAVSRLSVRSSASKCKHFEVATGDPRPLESLWCVYARTQQNGQVSYMWQ